MNKIYFPGLNGVRFVAALLVIIDHIELTKSNFGFQPFWTDKYSSFIGAFGVTIFFVLSGFLITYLLLNEKIKSQINIEHFYYRRILRIWPLYFLIVLISFFIVPYVVFLNVPNYTTEMSEYTTRLLLFIGLLANVAFVYFPNVAFANVLWSVAVEEQFYLFWPHVIKLKNNLITIMIFLLVFYMSSKFIIGYILGYKNLLLLISRTRFSSMIIGGIGAYLVFNKHYLIKIIYNKILQFFMIFIFVVLLTNWIQIKNFNFIVQECISVVVCFLIINIATNKDSIIKLENKVFNYFGKVSYGLYVYHLFAVVLIFKLFPVLITQYNPSSLIGYPLTIISIFSLTSLISHFSYYYFENLFLKKKIKFSTIISGDMLKNQSKS